MGLPSITGPLTSTLTQTGQRARIHSPHMHISGMWEEIHADMEKMENAKTTQTVALDRNPFFFSHQHYSKMTLNSTT